MVIVCHWVFVFQNLNFIVLKQAILNAQYCVLQYCVLPVEY